MNAAQLINQTSGGVEFYTPPEILNAARISVGGAFHLDPASSTSANDLVLARNFYSDPWHEVVGTISDLPVRHYSDRGGLEKQWWSNGEHRGIWMNHPFNPRDKACVAGCDQDRCKKRGWHTATDLPGNEDWISQFCSMPIEFVDACNITFASTSEAWFRPLLKLPQCFLYKRTNYLLPDGTVKKGVTKGSVVSYLGLNVDRFYEAFKHLGEVKIPYTRA
jgi:hypothetical protein